MEKQISEYVKSLSIPTVGKNEKNSSKEKSLKDLSGLSMEQTKGVNNLPLPRQVSG
ncbi:MAG: hypothetical protein JJU13_11935 [Balneolaceae bacterium]|nr:hypothetical protein [Balneolaceae bacterium]